MLGNRLGRLLGAAALFSGLVAGSAEAAESRFATFLFPCDGSPKVVNLTVGDLGYPSIRFIHGAEIILFENGGGLRYVVLSGAQGVPRLVSLSLADNRASNQFTDFLPVVTSPPGQLPLLISGMCDKGAGQVQGVVTIWFR